MPLVYRESLPIEEPKGTVLCVHGWPETSYMWRHLLEAVADAGWQAVAPDLPGYGDSPLGGLRGTWTEHVERAGRVPPRAGARRGRPGHARLGRADRPALGVRAPGPRPRDGDHQHGVLRRRQVARAGRRACARPIRGKRSIDGVDREGFAAMLRSVSPGMDDRALDEYFKAYGSEERRRGQLSMYRSGEFSELEDYDLAGVQAPSLILWGADDPFAPVAGRAPLRQRAGRHVAGGRRGRRALRLRRRAGALLARGRVVPGAGLSCRCPSARSSPG